MDLLLGPLTDLGFCQPDGTFITSWTTCASGLRDGRMRRGGVPGWAGHPGATTQSWANQKVLYDAKRHTHTAQGLALSTIHGDLLWSDGGWPDSCHEHELVALAGLEGCWTRSRWQARWIGGFGAWPRPASTGMRQSGTAAPSTGSPRGSGRPGSVADGDGRLDCVGVLQAGQDRVGQVGPGDAGATAQVGVPGLTVGPGAGSVGELGRRRIVQSVPLRLTASSITAMSAYRPPSSARNIGAASSR
jgi:hypothetical protein